MYRLDLKQLPLLALIQPILALLPCGTTLSELRQDNFPESKDNSLEEQLAKALRALTSYGVKYIDAKLDNFLAMDDGQVMIVDFSRVKFHTTKV